MDNFDIVKGVKPLFEAEQRRLVSMQDALVTDHKEITLCQDQGFLFNGDLYYHSKATIHSRLPMLAWALNDRMEAYLKEKKKFETERSQINQMLIRLLHLGTTDQKMRDVIPDCIIYLVPHVSRLNRSVSVETMISHDARLLRQYIKILPLIQLYSVTRLMY